MQKEKALQNFGLTESEINLYITLLKLGEATANTLSIQTNTNRTFTYDRLKKLIEKGLVSYVIKDNKKYFNPADPSQLLSILKNKEEQIKSILPDLEKLKSEKKVGPKVEIFTSKKGVSTVLNLILKDSKEVLIHGTLLKFQHHMKTFYEIWNSRRSKEKIKAKILTNEEVEIPYSEISLLSEEENSSTTSFLFGNKVILVLWSDDPVAILIENQEIANNNITFFNSIWNREIKIYSGTNGIKKAWMELLTNKTKELVGYGFSWHLAQIYGRDFSEKWQKQRNKYNISTRLISYDDPNSKKYFNMRMVEWKDFKLKYINKDFCGPACIVLSNELIVTFLYTEKKFRVILSKNKEMINVYKKHFEILWKQSKS